MKHILVIYSHFSPAFKAGGPIRSIQNMVELIKRDFVVDVVCSAYDLGEKQVLQGINPNQWNKLQENLNVFYIKSGGFKWIASAFNRNPDLVYINGVFLPLYTWFPLLLAKIRNVPVVITPRGMLQAGAMAKGLQKKWSAITVLKAFRLHRNVTWQATDEKEKLDIRKWFGEKALIEVVGNAPKAPLEQNTKVTKNPSELRLIYFSLIAAKKNLALVLTLLKAVQTPIVFDIFGPVKDKEYWKDCLGLMTGQIHRINYGGPVAPSEVQNLLKKYHGLILLTKGENFGHAIYEALSAGTPAVISQYTPWGKLEERDAGITVDIHKPESCCKAIESFLTLSQTEFQKLSDGAFQLAREYYSSADFKELYTEMFTRAENRRHFSSLEAQNSRSLTSQSSKLY